MIIKIWSIKARSGSRGHMRAIQEAVEYITDARKVMDSRTEFPELEAALTALLENRSTYAAETLHHAYAYRADEDCFFHEFITGYLCDPDTVAEEFDLARVRLDQPISGNVAYHIVQSFPVGLDISDTETHQCGIELCEKLRAHQALLCSHIHPLMDEDGVAHGLCKHNHILINAFVHPDFVDPAHPRRLKYNDCRASYQQLQVWNDEIAIDHGLPIILMPDEQRGNSRAEAEARKTDTSWKWHLRQDINWVRDASWGWQDFVARMEALGYGIKDGLYVMYFTPDRAYSVKGKTLGWEYTKLYLQEFWRHRNDYMRTGPAEVAKLQELVQRSPTCTVALPLAGHKAVCKCISLSREGLSQEAIESYFLPGLRYQVYDAHDQLLLEVWGETLRSHYLERDSDEIRNERALSEKLRLAQAHRGGKKKSKQKEDYYSSPAFRNSRTNEPYRVNFYDQYGRRISALEAMLSLAVVVLLNEDDLWIPSTIPPDKMNQTCYAPTDWKVQSMLDTIKVAREEGISSEKQLLQRIEVVGASCSRAKIALSLDTHAREKMQNLQSAILEFENTRVIVEELGEMPAGPEKDAKLKGNQAALERYEAAKATMYAQNVRTDEQILDCKRKWKQIEEHIAEASERYDRLREEYRKLKKLEYHTQLAQMPLYCYGPEYPGAVTAYEKGNGQRHWAGRDEGH